MRNMLSYPRDLVILWAAWSILILGFQSLLPGRIQISRPDHALLWTPSETAFNSQKGKIYLIEPFMNRQVSWDSEYYLSIAVGGYEDPQMRRIQTRLGPVSQNYAFFPLYPLCIRLLAFFLRPLELTPIATATLAGVMISLLGTLAGMLALWDLLRPEVQELGAWRGIFYLMVFPTGFFLAQVYTEGLFIGLAFGALALARRGHWGWAALLSILATLTRAVGIALFLPLGLAWLKTLDRRQPILPQLTGATVLHGLSVAAPLIVYLLWQSSHYGQMFTAVEDSFFGRGLFVLGASLRSWGEAVQALIGGHPQSQIYYALEFSAVFLALAACLVTFRYAPDLALFGLLTWAVAVFSGVAQSMSRYMLVIPSTYLLLGRWGRNEVFDRIWTILSVLLLGMSLLLFSYDMWVG